MYRLLAPRHDFAMTMTEDEQRTMADHAAYWTGLLETGTLFFSPVADPAGVWGVAIVEAGTREEVVAMGTADPAVRRGVCDFDVLDLPAPAVARRVAPLSA